MQSVFEYRNQIVTSRLTFLRHKAQGTSRGGYHPPERRKKNGGRGSVKDNTFANEVCAMRK